MHGSMNINTLWTLVHFKLIVSGASIFYEVYMIVTMVDHI